MHERCAEYGLYNWVATVFRKGNLLGRRLASVEENCT